jgi:MaoC dehydratase-like protein
MIRHWVDAIGDDNPIYIDEAAAQAAGHPGIVAPPAMIQVWTMMGLGGERPATIPSDRSWNCSTARASSASSRPTVTRRITGI